MDQQKKIERQYEKWLALNDNSYTEFDQQKGFKAFDKLMGMFETKETFNEYWKTKVTYTFINKLIK